MSRKLKLFRKHSPQYVMTHLFNDEVRELKRSLTWKDIAIMSISVCVGAGIFSVGAKVIVFEAGPSAIISFIIAGAVCTLAAMCYAEFSAVLPITGSAYTYSYSVLGEFIAWVIGWNMILELFLAVTVILKYWCIYLYDCVRLMGINGFGPLQIGTMVKLDWPIFIFAIFMLIVLIKGADVTTRVASVFVVIKLVIIAVIIFFGLSHFNFANLSPFIPDVKASGTSSGDVLSQTFFSYLLGQEPSHFGIFGIFAGAGIIIFAFVGFDMAASAAEETKNPRKNVPFGLMAGVGAVTLIYVTIGIVNAGMVSLDRYNEFLALHPDQTPSLATAFEIVGDTKTGAIISFGIFVGLTSVLLISMLSFSRVAFAISRDGLLPRSLSITHKKYHTPHRILIVGTVLSVIVVSTVSIDVLSEMINIGTLSAFIVVSFAIPIFRKRRKGNDKYIQRMDGEKVEYFKVPFSPFLPILSGVICIWLSLQLQLMTWICFSIWLVVGLLIYFFYGYRNSELNKHPEFVLKEK